MTLDVDDIMSDPSSTSSESSFSSDASIEDNLADLDAKRDTEEEPDDVADDPDETSENTGKIIQQMRDSFLFSIWHCTSSIGAFDMSHHVHSANLQICGVYRVTHHDGLTPPPC